ncbi:hypothetical protein H5410_045693 [Solanum commersonii]|uniref:Uncharacterized protein n=1 Tax=Solanum commersonii TaxID=4109 RepID=A0A9J5XA98_SOLCO|nr:hypothetical protein H5410_045693 [Solanum commersonii]
MLSPIGLPEFSNRHSFQLTQDQKGLSKDCNGAECKSKVVDDERSSVHQVSSKERSGSRGVRQRFTHAHKTKGKHEDYQQVVECFFRPYASCRMLQKPQQMKHHNTSEIG